VGDAWRAAANAAMDRYAEGDDGAFSELYDLVAPRIHAYLVRQTRDRTRAEDLLQQTLLQMHCARQHYIPGAEVMPWAFAIARRLLIDGIRKDKREILRDETGEKDDEAPLSTDAPADEIVQAKELAGRLGRELSRLPESQRVAFQLVKEEGLSLAEAAQVLGTTVAAVKLRTHRTYEALRGAIGEAPTPAPHSSEVAARRNGGGGSP
jgi:RNA polymerase sigma-70 factor (ECF subfamily)